MKSNRFVMPLNSEPFDPSKLKPPATYIHKEDKVRIAQLATAIKEANVMVPILADQDDVIIDGVQRWKAALLANLNPVPVLRLVNATKNEITTVRLALNKLQTGARFDETTLTTDLQELLGQGVDLTKLGFQTGELDALFNKSDQKLAIGELRIPENAPPLLRPDDEFRLEQHRILVGDSRDRERVKKFLGSDIAAAVVMDPPYNVPIDGHVSGLGRNKHEEFAIGVGEFSEAEFTAFLYDAMDVAQTCLKPAGYQYVFLDWRSMHLLRQASDRAGLQHVNTAVWVKSNAGMGSFYRSQHEMCGVFRKPGTRPTNNIQLGKFGRSRSNVWDQRGANAFGGARDEDLKDHPTVKPIGLIEGIIKDCTKRDEIVLDLFGGSGSTMLAAHRCGRQARVVEIEPKYVEVTLRRMQAAFDVEAIHVETGLTFGQLREQRVSEQQIEG